MEDWGWRDWILPKMRWGWGMLPGWQEVVSGLELGADATKSHILQHNYIRFLLYREPWLIGGCDWEDIGGADGVTECGEHFESAVDDG
jgi:hypothetical protein